MKTIKFNLLFSLFFCILAVGCSDKDEIPVDADDNFITSVVLSVNDKSYEAVIENNTITVTVPYTVSLDGAKASFSYTTSAKIFPDPTSITDWDTERTFRVTSFNGKTNDYVYEVVKDEIRSDGNVELKTPSEVADFVESGVTIIKGDLIIGSDAENAEIINDITGLSILKEVEGNIIIKNSFTGGTLTGLDNITAIGGLLIGSEENPLQDTSLEMISMSKIKNVTGDIQIYGSGASIIEFKELEKVDGNVIFNENTKLTQISLPVLKEVGSLEFKVLPREFNSLSIPEIISVNGNLTLESIYGEVETAGMRFFMGNTELKFIEGLDKLTLVKGNLSIQNFEKLENLPNWNNLTHLGGINLCRIHLIESLDLGKISFESSLQNHPVIKISECKNLENLITKNDLSNVDVYIDSSSSVKTNFTKVNNYFYKGLIGDLKISIQDITGDLAIIQNGKTDTDKIDIPDITSIPGYLLIDGSNIELITMQNIKEIGGQVFLSGDWEAIYNFPKLEKVCCAASPNCFDQDMIVINPNVKVGSMSICSSNIEDTFFPALQHIGGFGLTLYQCKSISFQSLEIIDGTFSFTSLNKFTGSLSFPKLSKLSGVHFNTVRKFSDFTFFKKFIDDGQIKESNWKIENCTYNPTYQDMKEGRCKPVQ